MQKHYLALVEFKSRKVNKTGHEGCWPSSTIDVDGNTFILLDSLLRISLLQFSMAAAL